MASGEARPRASFVTRATQHLPPNEKHTGGPQQEQRHERKIAVMRPVAPKRPERSGDAMADGDGDKPQPGKAARESRWGEFCHER